MQAKFQCTGIGNAIVDVIAEADEAFLEKEGIVKGAMNLIDAARAEELYSRMGPGKESSGGSAGNTMAGFASLGGKGAYIGKVSKDQLGDVFAHDIKATGIHFDTPVSTTGTPTARCLILVTSDAQRSMNTFLGSCVELGQADVDADLIKDSEVVYMEGYLYDPPEAQAAFQKASNLAHAADRKVAFTLSDAFCVGRHRDAFKAFASEHVDILFANETEILSLYETEDLDAAVTQVGKDCGCVAVTRSEKGSLVIQDGKVFEVPAAPVAKVVDTTGAGDLYAAGFLFGLTHGKSPADCGRLGSLAAAEVIAHYGARPETSLIDLAKEQGLL